MVARVSAPLVVTLRSSNLLEITVPASVTIPAGRSSVGSDFTVVDDAVKDGTQEVAVAGTAAGYTGGQDVVAVLDND